MTWATTKEAVRLSVAAALRLEDYTGADGVAGSVHKVEWVNKQQAVRYLENDSAWVDLQLNSPVAQGTDEIRYEFVEGLNAAASRLIPTYCGRRLFSVSVMIGVLSQEDDEEAVGTLGGLLRTRLRRAEILGILQAAGVALRSIGPTIPADYQNEDGHWVSNSVTEIFLACTESDTDPDEAGDFISSTDDCVGTLTDGVNETTLDADVVT